MSDILKDGKLIYHEPKLRPENHIGVTELSDRFVEAIERTVRSVAQREKYGVSNQILNALDGSPSSIPAHLALHRWEVKDISSFPSDIQLAIQQKRAARKHIDIRSRNTRIPEPYNRTAIGNATVKNS
ncbi:hypothetical protein DFQ28_000376 [Apophysomyces sp. BC1034]|nr:hypothetical protein DFQ28_000376 [Apophysomyces sp. BC1034]